MENQINNLQGKSHNTRTIAGAVLLGLGVMVLLKHSGFYFFPHLLFSWPVIMIALGIYVGAKHNFQKSNWIFITAIGVLFLIPNIIPSLHVAVLWPIVLIALGIRMLTRHNQYWNGQNWEKRDGGQFHSFDKNI